MTGRLASIAYRLDLNSLDHQLDFARPPLPICFHFRLLGPPCGNSRTPLVATHRDDWFRLNGGCRSSRSTSDSEAPRARSPRTVARRLEFKTLYMAYTLRCILARTDAIRKLGESLIRASASSHQNWH